MNFRWPFAFVALTIALSCNAWAQDSKQPKSETKAGADAKPATKLAPTDGASQAAELAAIRATAVAFEKAFDAGDAKAIAALWTADGEFVDETGRRLQGRDEIEKAFATFFAANHGLHMISNIERLRLVNDETAIEDGIDVVEPAPAGAPGTGRYTAIHVKRDGNWLMWSVRETRIDTPSNYGHLENLEHMIGTWVAANQGVEFQATSRWIANKNFVEQKFESRKAGQIIASGRQIIGWDPVEQSITSWTFSSDGGHALGLWRRFENGWIVQSSGTMMDGTPTAAVNIITKLDDNAVMWRSVNRSAGAFRVLDTNEVVLKRKPVERK